MKKNFNQFKAFKIAQQVIEPAIDFTTKKFQIDFLFNLFSTINYEAIALDANEGTYLINKH